MKKMAIIAILSVAVFLIVADDQRYHSRFVDTDVVRQAPLYCQSTRRYTPPKQFSSDGCSLFPQAFGEHTWEACCVVHDAAYWCGGDNALRAAADAELRACGNNVIPGAGTLMSIGAKLGGAPWLPTPWRWNYGTPYSP